MTTDAGTPRRQPGLGQPFSVVAGSAAEGSLVPPQALEAERGVLAAMLLSPEAVARAIESIDAKVFYRGAHQKMFEAMVALFDRNEKIDLITLSEELRKRGDLETIGGVAAVSQIEDYASTPANVEQYIRIVHSKAILRALIDATREIQGEAYAGSDESSSILDRAEQRIFKITDQRVRQGFIMMKDLMMPTMKTIEELHERKALVTGVPSGYDDLDKMTAGFQKSDLVIIAGRPSMGKTSFAMNIAENASIQHGKNVAVLSLEMSKEQIALRLMCSQSEVPLHRVRSGHLSESEFRRLANLTGGLYKASIVIDDTAAPTVLEIRAKCRRLKAENRLDMVIIDYLQLIRASGRSENRNQEISQITRSMKGLAKELDIPIIALSQLSRAPEGRGVGDRRPQLSDLRESGCLTADTKVWRADTGAQVPMGELLERGETNVPVWTMDDDLRLTQGVMTKVFPSGIKPVFELRLASGLSVKASANHPFYAFDGWKALGELRVGDRLAVPRSVPEPSTQQAWSESQIIMLAHLLGDGCFAPRQPVHYTSCDEANLDAVERAAGEFGVTPRRVAQKSWHHVYLPSPYRLTHGRRNPIVGWLSGFGLDGLRSYEKFIPAEVFSFSRKQATLFIRHLWATDGCVHLGKSSQPRIYYSSSSLRLATDLQALLLRFEIQARLKKTVKGAYRPNYHLNVYGSECQRRFLGEVGTFGPKSRERERIDQLLASKKPNTNVDTVPVDVWSQVRSKLRERGMTTRQFAANLGTAYCGSTLYRHSPSRGRLDRVASLLDSSELERMAGSGVFWDTIRTIEPLGPQPVFDATVPGTHNFLANGIIAHNSIEQDADVVLFVFREEMYKRDDPSLRGKADIIIAKQRNGPTGDVKLTFLHEFTKFVPYSPVMPGETDPGF